MYRVATINDVVRVPPKYFASELSNAVVQLLRDKYERNLDRDLGIILSVFNVRDISDGSVIHGDGASFHKVTFDCLVYYPEVNEVLDGEVTELVEFGLFVRMGPLEGLVHLSQITNDFLSYDKKVPAFIGKESKKTVKKGDFVRAKISTVSLKNSIPETKIGLTMRPEGLGKPEWMTETHKKEEVKKPEKKEKKEKEPRQKRGE
ncbi:MAG: DNA-directed RNA polymerase [Candidatus Micrarchaeota archaeon]|nr:DNA-directed RNA polymerase [Candidatus Micrarchaeota archaeon]